MPKTKTTNHKKPKAQEIPVESLDTAIDEIAASVIDAVERLRKIEGDTDIEVANSTYLHVQAVGAIGTVMFLDSIHDDLAGIREELSKIAAVQIERMNFTQ